MDKNKFDIRDNCDYDLYLYCLYKKLKKRKIKKLLKLFHEYPLCGMKHEFLKAISPIPISLEILKNIQS